MTWVTVAVAVGSEVINAEQQRAVAKRQDNQLAAQLRQQQASEQKVAQRTQQFIQSQQGQTDVPQKTAEKQAYDTALSANKNMQTAPLATTGNVSDAYKKATADAALGVANYANTRAGQTAAIDAPGLQRLQNQRNIADFGIDVNTINRAQKSQDYLDSMKLNSIHANPWVGLLTGVGSGLARARLMNSGAGATDMPPPDESAPTVWN